MMVETHPCPEEAWSDGPQSLTFEEFSRMMKDLEPYIDLWKQSRPAPVAAEAKGTTISKGI
jgi:3-deoxy-D-manno-octulosonic acid (KDO) 8-phosphate synthase